MEATKAPSFRKSLEAQRIEDLLRAAAVGEVVTYAAMSQAIGRDVLTCRGYINTARRALLSDARMVFDAVAGEGYRRLTDAETIGAAEAALRSIGRKARRGIRIAQAADYSALSRAEKVRHNVTVAQLGGVKLMSSHGATVRLDRAISDGGAVPEIGDTLRLLADGK